MRPLRFAFFALAVLAAACARPAVQAPPSAPPRTPPPPVSAPPPVASAGPKKPAPPPLPDQFDPKAVDDYVAGYVKDNGFVGLSLAVVRGGKLVLSKGYGSSSRQTGAPVTPDTPFAIGSITKQFTCAAVLLLAEQKKLSLQDSVSKYYPKLTRAKDITLDDLLSHVAGYPDYYPLDFVDSAKSKPIEPDKLIERFATGKLDFEPRSRWSYSNTGFVIAGRVAEKVSGEPMGAFLRKRVFEPLGMQHSHFEPEPGTAGLAVGHTAFALGDPEPAPVEGRGWLHAAGAMYASAVDLATWDLALMDGKILRPESHRVMRSPRELSDGRATDYACGLMVGRDQGETVLHHGGAVSGFLAFNAMVPRTRTAVLVMANADFVDLGALHRQLVKLVLKGDKHLPVIQGPPPRDVALDLLHQLQAGSVDRSKLGEDFSLYLGEQRVKEASARLRQWGEPKSIQVEGINERGGMQVASIRFNFQDRSVRALLYRSEDGRVQEFLLFR